MLILHEQPSETSWRYEHTADWRIRSLLAWYFKLFAETVLTTATTAHHIELLGGLVQSGFFELLLFDCLVDDPVVEISVVVLLVNAVDFSYSLAILDCMRLHKRQILEGVVQTDQTVERRKHDAAILNVALVLWKVLVVLGV